MATTTTTSSTTTQLRDLDTPNTLSSYMEFGDHHHHRDDEEEDEEEEEEESSEEMMMMMNNNTSSGLNRVKMAEALSQVQIQPVPPPMTAAGSSKPRYRECLRNHAINVMGHALDGCCEFMPGGPEGSVEALKCAACGCHRNFHRKEEPAGDTTATLLYPQHTHHHQPPPHPPGHHFGTYYRTPPSGYLHLGPPPTPRLLALPSITGAGGSLTRGEDVDVSNPNGAAMVRMGNGGGSGTKRFRTKFTAEQKERMLAMAERIGWRIQKCDEELVQQFCHETDVKRHVFKVWMHNNKHTLGKTINMTSNTNNNNSSSSNSSKQQLMS